MKLGIELLAYAEKLGAQILGSTNNVIINRISHDTRTLGETNGTLFFAFDGQMQQGVDFIPHAFDQGVRLFVVDRPIEASDFPGATFLKVADARQALYKLAQMHRATCTYPVLMIAGGRGKTTVKEWLFHLLNRKKVVRSPKSYNSTLGVALSVLEMQENKDLAIIEVKPHLDMDPELVQQMVRPTHGLWMTFGSEEQDAAWENYINRLFAGVHFFLGGRKGNLALNFPVNYLSFHEVPERAGLSLTPTHYYNLSMAWSLAMHFEPSEESLEKQVLHLPSLAFRTETFEGNHGNIIINDLYNLDLEALRSALEYQQLLAKGKSRAVLICHADVSDTFVEQATDLAAEFGVSDIQVVENEQEDLPTWQDTFILVKGDNSTWSQRYVRKLKLYSHATVLQYDLQALKKNLLEHKSYLRESTKLMAMVKASSYGTGIQKMGKTLEEFGIDYLGVAYADEGVEIREFGVKTPIMVMNAEEPSFGACIEYQLEPAIYDFDQLDAFIREAISYGVKNYPIHIKFNTGMNRLGFAPEEADRIISIVQAQPEIRVQSLYSHLASADNLRDKRFAEFQIHTFSKIIQQFKKALNNRFETHICNSDGIAIYGEGGCSMARIGIGMFGISAYPPLQRKLEPVMSWKSSISQLQDILPGQTVGYARSFQATKKMKIATIPVGYADGYKRNLSNGVGAVAIRGILCPVVGRVCMDMIMVDVSHLTAQKGEAVEIIGPNITLQDMAVWAKTIPYEILTSLSPRLQRVYVEG